MAQCLYCGRECAGLKTDGSIVSWDVSIYGGDTESKDVTDIAQVVCGWHACTGLKTNCLVIAQGDSGYGG